MYGIQVALCQFNPTDGSEEQGLAVALKRLKKKTFTKPNRCD